MTSRIGTPPNAAPTSFASARARSAELVEEAKQDKVRAQRSAKKQAPGPRPDRAAPGGATLTANVGGAGRLTAPNGIDIRA